MLVASCGVHDHVCQRYCGVANTLHLTSLDCDVTNTWNILINLCQIIHSYLNTPKNFEQAQKLELTQKLSLHDCM